MTKDQTTPEQIADDELDDAKGAGLFLGPLIGSAVGQKNAQLKDLEAQDRLGNHEIQRMMQSFNREQQSASSTLKKLDDTSNAVIGKI
ncbi:MAG: hypothetical protein AAFR17_20085 [Pseudomonadota bacterium]